MFTRRLIAWLCFVFVAALILGAFARSWAAGPVGAAPAASVAPEGRVDVYPGPERPGLSRRACGFKDGLGIRRGEIVDNRVVITSTGNQEYYRSQPIGALSNYAVQSLDCVRSGTRGTLVVVVGGFYAGSSGQQSLTLSTDYAIHEEISCEENPACTP